MLSRRSSWDLEPNWLAQLITAKSRAGEAILDLTESNPTRVGLAYPDAQLLSCLACPEARLYEPDPLGHPKARRALAQHHLARGHQVSSEQFLLTAGTSEAYSFLFRVLADPGDRILVSHPGYPLLEYLAKLDGLEISSFPLCYEDGWWVDFSALYSMIDARTRAILVVHPNNPTGSFIKDAERRTLLELCRRHGLALIVDEVFLDYPLQPAEPVRSFMQPSDVLTFVLGGLSKGGLPQLKLAWMWSTGPHDRVREVRRQLEQVSDLFLSVGTPVQLSLPCLLELAQDIRKLILGRLRTNLLQLQETVSWLPACDLPKVEGGWYAVVRLPAVLTSEEWAVRLLSEASLHLHPGYLFDLPWEACLVVSLLVQEETFRAGTFRLRELVEKILRHPDG